MNFTSLSFTILFSIVFFARLTFGRTKTNQLYLYVLLISSLVFYLWHIPVYVFIILTSTCIDYIAGRQLGKAHLSDTKRFMTLMMSLTANLGLLCYFKYANFFINEISRLFDIFQWSIPLPHLDIILPMGISFYTFQSMSYTIDVYRRKLAPQKNFFHFLLYVSFFPQLTAGPIVRAKEFLYQINRKRSCNLRVFSEGIYLVIRGLFLKVVLADNLGTLVDLNWSYCATPGTNNFHSALIIILFSCQIFTDFAGYSSIARGLAYLLGFRLPINFNNPYMALTFKEFWTRWHITLSRWLKDYLYISLGGNRHGYFRTLFNLLTVMLLGGLWHGASIRFVIWGGIHGVALIIERILKLESHTKHRNPMGLIIQFLFVQCTVLLAWVFFRAEDFAQAFTIIQNILNFKIENFGKFPSMRIPILVTPIILMHFRGFLYERFGLWKQNAIEKSFWAGIMLYLVLTCFGVKNDFIYFQF